MDLRLAGVSEPLHLTDRHRLFSATRQDWVSASELRAGEDLATRSGTARIQSVSAAPGTHRVFNIEAESEHCFFAGSAEVLSHNTEPYGNFFRGGDKLKARLNSDVEEAADSLIHPKRKNGRPQGISLHVDPKNANIQRHGGAFPVKRLPEGLQILPDGSSGHYVVAPSTPMTFERYQELLNQIELGDSNLIR